MEKGLVKIMGRKDLPGRPIIYGTTKGFLELFGLNTLSDLPSLKDIQPPPSPEEIAPEEVLNDEILKTKTEAGSPLIKTPLWTEVKSRKFEWHWSGFKRY